MFNKKYIPSVVTVIRFIAAPLFFITFLDDMKLLSLLIFVFAGITDIFDGYIARKIGATSNIGAYLDVFADFVLIVTCFSAFVLTGWYDLLVLILIISMFLLFITTSGLKKPVYDPVGKYFGSFLMIMIFLSLLFPGNLLRQILQILLVLFCLLSVLSRSFQFYIISENSKN